jgi:arsenite oxidase small subunit
VAVIAESIVNGPGLPASGAVTTFPKVLIGTVSQLQVNQPISFNYPLDDEPNLLIDVGVAAEGGVGPNNSIVAFSNICQHLGCTYDFLAPGASPVCSAGYKAAQPMGYCCCHGSQYNFLKGAEVIGGPAPRPVPSVILEIDSSGNIYATGMNPPTIYGKGTAGSTDVTADLQGGNLVTSESST